MRLLQLGAEQYRSARGTVWGYAGSAILAALSPAALFGFSAYLLSKAALRPGILTLGVAIGSVRFFALSRGASQYGERMLGHHSTLSLTARIRVAIFKRLEAAAPYRLKPNAFSELMSSLNGDVEQLQNLILRLIGPLLGSVFAAAAASVAALLFSPALGLSILAASLLSALVIPWISYRVTLSRLRPYQETRRHAYDAALTLGDTFKERAGQQRGAPLVARVESTRRQLGMAAGRLYRVQLASGTVQALVTALALGATLILGLHEVASRHLAAVEIAIVPMMALALLENLGQIGAEFAAAASATASVRRLETILSLEGREQPDGGPDLPEGIPLAIGFAAAGFSYPGTAKPILDNLDLQVAAGTKLLVTGATGSGKSTLAHLVLGVWTPSSGTVSIGGIDTRELAEEQIAKAVTYLPPEPHLFSATLAANLRIARRDATDREIVSALTAVDLGGWLDGLPDGVETQVGQGGVPTSSGEAQRLAIARIVLARSANVILDEPTSRLDRANEELVIEILNTVLREATAIFITHSEVAAERLRYSYRLDLDGLRPRSERR